MNRFVKYLPFIIALSVALFWGFVYITLGKMHGMWDMFDQGFPFLFASVTGIHKAAMPPVAGMFFAMIDGAVAGGIFGWAARYVLKGRGILK